MPTEAKGTGRSAEQHYGTMALAAIKALPVKDLTAKDCALLLWTVSSMLPEALDVVKGWGFRFVNVAFDWVKVTKEAGKAPIGMGYYTRTGSEQCLLAARGKPQILSHAVRQVIMEPRRYRGVQALFPGPYLELFARERRDGWTTWGDQTDRFNEAEAAG